MQIKSVFFQSVLVFYYATAPLMQRCPVLNTNDMAQMLPFGHT